MEESIEVAIDDYYTDDEYCAECHGLGDDYGYDDAGDIIWLCSECLFNHNICDDD